MPPKFVALVRDCFLAIDHAEKAALISRP